MKFGLFYASGQTPATAAFRCPQAPRAAARSGIRAACAQWRSMFNDNSPRNDFETRRRRLTYLH